MSLEETIKSLQQKDNNYDLNQILAWLLELKQRREKATLLSNLFDREEEFYN